MPGVWKKTLQYLGLVEDEDYEELGEVVEAPVATREPATVRRLRSEPTTSVRESSTPEAIIRTIPQTRPAAANSIHRAEPKAFNEARELGERFKQGIPVIMNLQGTEDHIARRLVDFASGLVFGLEGKIEMVASRVYLLTPENMEVSAEERERLRTEGGFYNQL
ncbi:MAG TPA: cell division protein SepF [Actinomycetota bacterium]|nr:cell division protein SepF [Actinomycetota bacterium]